MYILGISCFYHDSAACLLYNGNIIAAVQEERFTRNKHDFGFPTNAIYYCLKKAEIHINDLDCIVFYDKPFIKFERILETYLMYAPRGTLSFLKALPLWIRKKLWIPDIISKKLGYKGQILFSEHHESHAASAYFPSPFTQAAFLTIDGVGEWSTTSYGVGEDNHIELMAELHFPHSLGLLYSAATYFTGFKVNSGEYKLMGLAPYGKPKYVQKIYDQLLDLKEDGSFAMNMKYFDYCAGLRMTNNRFAQLFDGPPRKPESEITQREMDIACSIQKVTEEVILRMARHVKHCTGKKNLCLAGGVALNCVANGKLLRSDLFENIWIQPAAGDAGGALGSSLIIYHHYYSQPLPNKNGKDLQKGSYLGPSYSNNEIKNFFDMHQCTYHYKNRETLLDIVSDLISEKKVIGWFQGRMEFGPRALGNRSILGDARSPQMQEKINRKIKFRESFRPFAPAVLKEKIGQYFEIDRESPYMLLVTDIKKEKQRKITNEEKKLEGMDQLKIVRSDIPAVTHVDFSSRLQSVSIKDNPLFYSLLYHFYEKTGCPVIINTSFNVRGEPIVESPEDAYKCFMRTDMDILVMGNYILYKKEQPVLNHENYFENNK